MAEIARRVALVTGGTRGIGLGIAEKLAERGFNLAINGRRESDAVASAIEKLSKLGAQVIYCRADIASAKDRRRMVDEILTQYGRIDALVNNAGVAPQQREDLLEATEESFEQLIRINLQGPYFLTQLVANQMLVQTPAEGMPRGTVVNVTSISASLASVNRGEYCISKAGLAMATKLWATRLAEHGIPVYEVRPGIIQTDMTAGVTEKYDRLIQGGLTLEPRWGTPEDVGRVVAWLAAGEAPYATGNVLYVDGGLAVPRL